MRGALQSAIIPHEQRKLGELVDAACVSRDARFVESALGQMRDILGDSQTERVAETLLVVLRKQRSLNSVAIEGLHHLRSVSMPACSAFARELLSEPANDDREMVHAAAISALIEFRGPGEPGLDLISRCVGHRFPQVRRACQVALRDLSGEQRSALLAELSEGHKDLRIFLTAAPPPAPTRSTPDTIRRVRVPARNGVAEKDSDARVAKPRHRPAVKPEAKAVGSRIIEQPVGAEKDVSSKIGEQFDGLKITPPAARSREASEPMSAHSRTLFQQVRRHELEALPLESLVRGAGGAQTPEDAMAYLAEVALRFSSSRAADCNSRLVWFLSDPSIANKELMRQFSMALLQEARREQSAEKVQWYA